MAAVIDRVDRLEEALEQFITSVGIEFNKLYNSQMRTEAELREFKEEMRLYREHTQKDTQAFKEEMRLYREHTQKDTQAFKEEMRRYREDTQKDTQVFKDEMRRYREDTQKDTQVFKDEMRRYREHTQKDTQAFKDEMRRYREDTQKDTQAFKDEMRAFKEENRRQTREMNRQWGEISNKLGTMVEDLVYPSLPRILQETLGREILDLGVRRKRRLADGRVKEFDAVAVMADLIGLNSTKATLRSADMDRFVEDIAAFREFFPEYRELPVVGILATLAVEESVLNYAEKLGFLVLAVGDEIMEVKNRPGFEPKRWSGG